MSAAPRQPIDAPRDDSWAQLCAFRVGDTEYAVDIRRVLEILPPPRVTPVPGAPVFVEGVINLRGSIVAVVDLRRRFGGRVGQADHRSRLVVCRVGRRRVALRVDAVTQVLRAQRSELRPAPGFASGPSGPFVIGVCGPPERLRLLLNVKALLSAEENS